MRTPLAVAAVLAVALIAGCAARPGSPTATVAPVAPSSSPSASRPKPSTDPSVAHGVGPAGSVITTGSEAVALTFDDGPWPDYTPQLLDMLKAANVKATFCVIGKQAQAYPDLIRRIYNEGHSLCNHSWRHDLELDQLDDASIRDDLNATNKAIHDAAPMAQIGYFRAPGGNFDDRLAGIVRSMGMTPLYWYVDTRDWESAKYGHGQSMVDNIVTRVERDSRRGAIILSHDKELPDTITAYQTLLPWLTQHYQLIALPPDGRLPRP